MTLNRRPAPVPETVYAVQSFREGPRGTILADPVIRCISEGSALRGAARLAETKSGVIAWSAKIDPVTQRISDERTILFSTGRLPEGVLPPHG